jgi:hypothetical protein
MDVGQEEAGMTNTLSTTTTTTTTIRWGRVGQYTKYTKESRAAQCQVSRDMKSGGFASRRVNGQWVWQRVRGLDTAG